MRTTIRQRYCSDVTDHDGHDWFELNLMWLCPGRYTPSAHRMPHQSPAVPSDPFAGIDESTEFDATRPAVS